jgi:hypothetical protein
MTVTFEDRRTDYGEERFVTLGPLGDAPVVIVTAEAEDHIRIISMRKADRHEQRIYHENIKPGGCASRQTPVPRRHRIQQTGTAQARHQWRRPAKQAAREHVSR